MNCWYTVSIIFNKTKCCSARADPRRRLRWQGISVLKRPPHLHLRGADSATGSAAVGTTAARAALLSGRVADGQNRSCLRLIQTLSVTRPARKTATTIAATKIPQHIVLTGFHECKPNGGAQALLLPGLPGARLRFVFRVMGGGASPPASGDAT